MKDHRPKPLYSCFKTIPTVKSAIQIKPELNLNWVTLKKNKPQNRLNNIQLATTTQLSTESKLIIKKGHTL